jgi:uncharacterized protein YgiM (DUF1202 family)
MKLIGLIGLAVFLLNGLGWFAIYETAVRLGIPLKSTVSGSTVSTTTESAKPTATVISDSLNMRHGPSAKDTVIITLKKGDRLTITGDDQNGWLPVEIDDNRGFVNDSYVSIDEN